ncbi:MAG TPA: D-aminoacylase [Gemmatimonadaceae bacterium]|nr:D-aminoacylase [Gemmatimonadaceae bacterium]
MKQRSPTPITRRRFLGESSALFALAMAGRAPAIHLPGRKSYDIIIRNGTLFDGTLADPVEADLAISGSRIAAIGRGLGSDARVVIDARGFAVAPGFIDIHSHADGSMFDDPNVESVVREGITTVIVGQDGSSRAPRRLNSSNADSSGDDGDDRAAYRTVGDVLSAVEQLPCAVNVASMVGLGTVRHVVVGDDDRPATPDELARMTALVEASLASGACGASSGLEYTPGLFASLEELIALCKPLAKRGLPYATHMRNEDDRVLQSIDESIAVARGAGCPLEISHLKTQGKRNWGKIDDAFRRIADARKAGIDVTFDRYPYIAYQTGLSNLFPKWSKDGGSDAFIARLSQADLRPRLRKEVLAKVDLIGGWDNVMISGVANEDDKSAEGQRLERYAKSLGRDPYDVAEGLLTRSRGGVGMVGFAMSEDNVARFLSHPLCMVCSDGGAYATEGPARDGHPHPRALGTFPRVLGKYVREDKVLTLQQAIHKMTGAPAARLKLTDRGLLKRDNAADVVVFDPDTVIDRATFAQPFQYPDGISVVIVNGQIALRHGERTDTERRSGKAVRPG